MTFFPAWQAAHLLEVVGVWNSLVSLGRLGNFQAVWIVFVLSVFLVIAIKGG